MEGWIKLHRGFFNNPVWKNPVEQRLFLWIIGNAVFSEYGVDYGIVKIRRGQYLRSFRNLQNDLQYIENKKIKTYSLTTIQKAVQRLVKAGRLTAQTTDLGTLFTVVNYNKYQERETLPIQDNNNKIKELEKYDEITGNSEKTVSIQSVDNNKNDKNDNNVNNNKYIYPPNSDEYRLASLLLELIRQRDNNFKEPSLQKWSKEINLLINKDNRSIEDIERVIKWCQQDAFWQNNILSTSKLREKFGQLYLLTNKNNTLINNNKSIINGNGNSRSRNFNVLGL